jgi:hypothetical protein
MSESDGTEKLDAILSHLARGRDLQDFSTTTTEKLGVIRTAAARRLIAWNKTRARYELTLAGWRRTAPRGSLGLAPLVIGATVGAAIGAAALAVLLPSADVPLNPVKRQALRSVPHPVAANVALATPLPAQPVSLLPDAPPAQLVPATPVEPVKPLERAAPEEPSPEATAPVAKQTSARKHRHHRITRARTRRMWAWAYRDERFARSGRIFR